MAFLVFVIRLLQNGSGYNARTNASKHAQNAHKYLDVRVRDWVHKDVMVDA